MSISKSSPKRSSRGARLILTFFALILIGAGSFFTYALWRAYSRAEETDHWAERPCVVLTSHVEEQKRGVNDPVMYRPVVEFTYIYNDEAFQAKSIRRVDGPKADRKAAEEVVAPYKQGSPAICYVNPERPSTAILIRETKAPLYTLWFPMLFVIGGIGMILGVWMQGGTDEGPAASSSPEVVQ